MKEQINLTETANASAGVTASMSEKLGLSGTYHGICRGYKPEHEAEYLREFPRLLALREQVEKWLRWTPTFAVATISKLVKELEDFERYMESLCEVKWDQYAPNVVTTVGANLALDTTLAGSAYTVTGPFMGLIGAVSYTGVPVIADTMASHATWTEGGTVNAPTYTGPRKTIAWAAAAAKSKAPSAAPVFAITGTGTAKGVFIVYGTGALSTIDNTAGVLYSAGLFSGGDQAVVNTNTLTITYAATA
ncbi:MAG: hypothetical protein Q8N51_05795 [Gammaproteobacteria bacterium]|nr:hypothetical protein [Gammaproteobacteria bacterium]